MPAGEDQKARLKDINGTVCSAVLSLACVALLGCCGRLPPLMAKVLNLARATLVPSCRNPSYGVSIVNR